MKIKLYKNGKLVDFGVRSNIISYVKQGYQVVVASDDDHEAIWTPPAKQKPATKKASMWSKIRSVLHSLVPEPAFAYGC